MALPLDIPKTQSHALQPCKVQVIINEIFGVQPEAESQMWPVVRSADRHAELGAVAASPPIHASSLQSPGEFHTARAHLVAHGIMAVASSSSLCSTSCWSSSSCDSLMAGGHHKVVSDRSASDESESNCSAREPSSVDIRHEVPSVSLVRPQVVFTPKAQQVTALAGPTVKSASTAEDFSKVYSYCSFFSHFVFALQGLLSMFSFCATEANIACVHGLFMLAFGCPCCYTV